MRPLLYGCFFLFLLSCRNRNAPGTTESKDTLRSIVKDTLLKASVDTTRHADSTDAVVYKELTHLDLHGYHISVLRDPEEAKEYLVAYNKTARKVDTAEISGLDAEGDDIVMLDATDSLQFKPLLLEVICPTGSDWYNHAFVGYDSGKLKQLFDIDNWPNATRLNLHRKDKWTLAGTVLDRDDLVQEFEQYPVEVSLKDYKVTHPVVPAIYVGWQSKVLESFKARRVINNELTDSMYIVKKGTRLVVDTLYVPQNKVHLRIKGSIILEAEISTVKGKITENGAG